ncbi:MAG: hypothetical protein AABY22_16945 [Nanoarchaeota archaeon]
MNINYSNNQFITIERGLRGWFALLADNEGPILSSDFSSDNRDLAIEDAIEWAESENIRLILPKE